MTVSELVVEAGFRVVNMPSPDTGVSGCYAGDLLSNVMDKASKGQCFATVMTCVNVAAIAALVDMPCVILCEGAEPDELMLSSAEARGLNIAVSDMPLYETCLTIGRLLSETE